MPPEGSPGFFVALEGGEGAGKSTLARALAERLRAAGHEVVATREPGGTPLGDRVRELLLSQDGLDDPLAELLLFEAARAHLVADVIRPALARGGVVICDRYSASSMAYQGFGRGLERETVERANDIATGGLAPDLTLLLDLPVAAGLARRSAATGAANHFDRADLAFHERVRAGYHDLAREAGERWRIIDASRSPGAVADAAFAAIQPALSRRRAGAAG